MNKKSMIGIVPGVLASVLLIAACDTKPKQDSVVVEEDIILKDGTIITEWFVEDVDPIPPRKPAVLAGKRPSNAHIWIPGEWERMDGKWQWKDGRWAKPPFKNAHWMAGHWRMDSDQSYWSPGHWTVTSRPYHFVAPLEAPPLLSEVKPEKPSDHNHWVAGHWSWDGDWYWVPGYWTTKPHPDAEWVAGHWDEFGIDGGYRWIGGHWRIKG